MSAPDTSSSGLALPDCTPDDAMPAASAAEELAAVLDQALAEIQAGRALPPDLLRRYPSLREPLRALAQLHGLTLDSALETPMPAQVGRYLIERQIGVGGFGTVFRAWDPAVRRHVAIKLLHPGRLEQEEAVKRFQREACVTARLHHPGIVRLFDYSKEGPPYFLVTEYVEGIDPRDWCRHKKNCPREAAGLVARIAEAVEHAHAQGVCHRDLKPANILVDDAGEVHVLDFGLARAAGLEESLATSTHGRVLGSLPYMPPEQASGHSAEADARSDVYSLGVILYELLTGRLPFEGPLHELPGRILEENPAPPTALRPGLSRTLEAICLKALARRPEDRYASAGELARDLRAWLSGDAVEAREYTWLSFLHRALGRRHRDTQLEGWTPLLLLVGATILAGCVVCNVWEWLLPGEVRWAAILATKAVQVGLMLALAIWLRPIQERQLTAAERQIWSLIPAYYGACLALGLVNLCIDRPIPMAPVQALLSGMGFMSLGATIWGWFYVWGVFFFALAVVIVFCLPYGLSLLGLGWFVCLAFNALHLRLTR